MVYKTITFAVYWGGFLLCGKNINYKCVKTKFSHKYLDLGRMKLVDSRIYVTWNLTTYTDPVVLLG
jgi:hypothetical protein